MDAWNLSKGENQKSRRICSESELFYFWGPGPEADDILQGRSSHHHFVGCSYPLPIAFQGLSEHHWTQPDPRPQGEPQQHLTTYLLIIDLL